jgi:hypothetical protein
MRIGIFDGSIEFEDGAIRMKASRAEFLATPLGRQAKQELVNGKWWHITVEPESGIVATLIFKIDILETVLIAMGIPTDRTGEWTRELELQRKCIHDAWLRRELGKPPYVFAWGTVASELDEKAVASEIIVAYGR